MNVAIVGAGHAGLKHAKAYHKMDNAYLYIAHDLDINKCPELGVGNTSIRSICMNDSIKIVSICTPSNVRYELISELIDHDKHILVEKPLALNIEEAQDIIVDCKESNVVLGVVMQKRFNPNIQKLCGEVRAQTLGKPLIASQVVRWYRPTSYYRGWKGETDKGGSILINQAIHHIDILQWILGPVRSVFGYAETLGHKINTTDAVVATLKFESGAIGTLEASTVCYPKNAGEHLTILSEWGRRTIDTAWPHHEPIIRNFVESVRENREPVVTGEESLKSLKIALAIQKSSDIGKEVYIDTTLRTTCE